MAKEGLLSVASLAWLPPMRVGLFEFGDSCSNEMEER